MGGEDGLDRRGPHLLPAGHDHLREAASHRERPVGSDLPPVAGGQPSPRPVGTRDARVDPVAVAAQQHGAAHEDLALLAAAGGPVADGHVDAAERSPVVDEAGAGLGQPVGGDDVLREPSRRGRPTEQHTGERRGVETAEGGGHERDVRRHTVTAERLDLGAVERRQHRERRPGPQGPGDDGEPADVSEGEAGQPPVASRVDPEPCGGRRRRGVHRLPGEHHAAGRPERAAGREHERVAGLDGSPPGEGATLEVRTDHGGGSELSGDGECRGTPEPLVHGHRRVPLLPDASECRHEFGASRQVERDEVRHRPVA